MPLNNNVAANAEIHRLLDEMGEHAAMFEDTSHRQLAALMVKGFALVAREFEAARSEEWRGHFILEYHNREKIAEYRRWVSEKMASEAAAAELSKTVKHSALTSIISSVFDRVVSALLAAAILAVGFGQYLPK